MRPEPPAGGIDLFVLGASGHGREMAELVRAAGDEEDFENLTLRGFLDDQPRLKGTSVAGYPVLGTLDDSRLQNAAAVLGVGYPRTKAQVFRRVSSREIRWPAVVHPSASLGSPLEVARGVVVQAGVVITTGVELKEFATVNVSASLSHDVHMEPFSTVSPGVRVAGNVRIDEGAFIGIGVSIIQGVTIGAWSVVGAGAVVIDDVEPNTVVAGVPARVISRREEGWQHA